MLRLLLFYKVSGSFRVCVCCVCVCLYVGTSWVYTVYIHVCTYLAIKPTVGTLRYAAFSSLPSFLPSLPSFPPSFSPSLSPLCASLHSREKASGKTQWLQAASSKDSVSSGTKKQTGTCTCLYLCALYIYTSSKQTGTCTCIYICAL